MILHKIFKRISDKGPVIVLTPFVSAIGNLAENIYFGLLQARREGKKLLILFPYELPWKLKFPIANRELLSVDSEYRWLSNDRWIVIFGRAALTFVYAPVRAFSRWCLDRYFGRPLPQAYTMPAIGLMTLWQPREDIEEFSWDIVRSYRWREQLSEYLPIRLPEASCRRAEAAKLKMGIPKDDWFVCLHVREGGFHNDYQASACRNASIQNYIPGIKAIVDAGGWVVRLGDKAMTPLPVMQRVIDYPHTSFKNGLMDIYLIQECRYFMGMQSGLMDTALLFQKPHLITNMVSWLFPYPQRPGDLGLLKHLYSHKRGRFLSVLEHFNEPWEAQHLHSLGPDYVMHENTSEEIYDVVVEFLSRHGKPANLELSKLQDQCNQERILRGQDILNRKLVADDVDYKNDGYVPLLSNHYDDMHNRYRLASRLDSALGALGRKFLEQNWAQSSKNRDLRITAK